VLGAQYKRRKGRKKKKVLSRPIYHLPCIVQSVGPTVLSVLNLQTNLAIELLVVEAK
jgi:hypothetical protein